MLQVEPYGVSLSESPSPRRPDGPLCGPHHARVVRGCAPPHVGGRHFGVELPNGVVLPRGRYLGGRHFGVEPPNGVELPRGRYLAKMVLAGTTPGDNLQWVRHGGNSS
jgi:hypothetical protein